MFLKYFIKTNHVKTLNLLRYFHKNSPLNHTCFLSDSPNADLNKNIYDRYMCLPIPEGKIQATYIWIDKSGINLRSKSRTLYSSPSSYKEVPQWTFNGGNTGQATEKDPTCHLVPIALYNDPVRRGNNKLVMCEVFLPNEKPAPNNHRQKCIEILNKNCEQEFQFKFEQEFIMLGSCGKPFGWPHGLEIIQETESSYCSVGARDVFGREIIECFYRACLYCGIDICSSSPEIMKGQWEFKIGPNPNIKAADDLWLSRWLLVRIAEDYGVAISFDPKFSHRWPGSGLHTGVSTKKMRDENGYKHIEDAIKKLEKRDKEDLKMFDVNEGFENAKRLIGKFLAPSKDKFEWGVGDPTKSIKIPKSVALKKRGSFEDRRPGSNADPYLVITALVKSIVT